MNAAHLNPALDAALILILSGLLACAQDRVEAVAPAPTGGALRVSLEQAKSGAFSGEEEFAVVAVAAPSFAGFFYAQPYSDTLVVAVADIADGKRARDAVARIFSRKNNLPPGQVLTVRKVRYSYLQLHRWRALVDDRLLKLRQATMLDLDEGHNTVTVGVTRAADSTTVKKIMRDLAIPIDAYRIILFSPVVGEQLVHQ